MDLDHGQDRTAVVHLIQSVMIWHSVQIVWVVMILNISAALSIALNVQQGLVLK